MVQLEHSLKTIYFSGIVFNEDKNDDVTSQCKGCRGKGKGQSSGNLSAAACVQPHLALSTPTSSSNHPQYFFGPLCIPRTCRPLFPCGIYIHFIGMPIPLASRMSFVALQVYKQGTAKQGDCWQHYLQ